MERLNYGVSGLTTQTSFESTDRLTDYPVELRSSNGPLAIQRFRRWLLAIMGRLKCWLYPNRPFNLSVKNPSPWPPIILCALLRLIYWYMVGIEKNPGPRGKRDKKAAVKKQQEKEKDKPVDKGPADPETAKLQAKIALLKKQLELAELENKLANQQHVSNSQSLAGEQTTQARSILRRTHLAEQTAKEADASSRKVKAVSMAEAARTVSESITDAERNRLIASKLNGEIDVVRAEVELDAAKASAETETDAKSHVSRLKAIEAESKVAIAVQTQEDEVATAKNLSKAGNLKSQAQKLESEGAVKNTRRRNKVATLQHKKQKIEARLELEAAQEKLLPKEPTPAEVLKKLRENEELEDFLRVKNCMAEHGLEPLVDMARWLQKLQSQDDDAFPNASKKSRLFANTVVGLVSTAGWTGTCRGLILNSPPTPGPIDPEHIANHIFNTHKPFHIAPPFMPLGTYPKAKWPAMFPELRAIANSLWASFMSFIGAWDDLECVSKVEFGTLLYGVAEAADHRPRDDRNTSFTPHDILRCLPLFRVTFSSGHYLLLPTLIGANENDWLFMGYRFDFNGLFPKVNPVEDIRKRDPYVYRWGIEQTIPGLEAHYSTLAVDSMLLTLLLSRRTTTIPDSDITIAKSLLLAQRCDYVSDDRIHQLFSKKSIFRDTVTYATTWLTGDVMTPLSLMTDSTPKPPATGGGHF